MMGHHTKFSKPHLKAGSVWAGKTVGVLGGSFNPVHEGHIHISNQALTRLPIDCLWWSFTPGNPFKKHLKIPSVSARIEQAQSLITDNRVIFTDIESQLGIHRTHELCAALHHYFPRTKFIWIGGMDLAEELHKWESWETLVETMPIVFFRRPPYRGTIKHLPLKRYQKATHIYDLPKDKDSYAPQHIYWALSGPTRKISSTEMRLRG